MKSVIEKEVKNAWNGKGFYYVYVTFYGNEEDYDINFYSDGNDMNELTKDIVEWAENLYGEIYDITVEFTGKEERELLL